MTRTTAHEPAGEFIEYRGGPLAGSSEPVRWLPPVVRCGLRGRGAFYRPTGETTATGRHIYQWEGQA
jgi:hypothetical protein